MEEVKIRVKGLTKIFGQKPKQALPLVEQGVSREEIKQRTGNLVALRDISFAVQTGEIFVVMGLSGSGKSTLLRCVNRLVDPDRGEIHIDKADIRSFSNQELLRVRRKKMAMVFQSFALFPFRCVADNVVFGLELQGMAKKERAQAAKDMLATVGLEGWEQAPVSSLSGGMQQRVGLARALAINPEILLMDEPFSALDPLIRTRMQDELLRLQKDLRKTVLFITHDLNEAIKIGDRVAILNQEGRVDQVGTPKEIFQHPATEYVHTFVENLGEQADRIEKLEL